LLSKPEMTTSKSVSGSSRGSKEDRVSSAGDGPKFKITDLPEDEEKACIPDDSVFKIRNEFRRQDHYPLEETKTRNVLIVGRSRAGKSTAVGVVKDACYEPKMMSIFSETRDPKFQSFSLDDSEKDVKYTLNIVDTPGLKEIGKSDAAARAQTDDEILKSIQSCLKHEITKLNVLLIFVSFEIGINQDDIECFKQYYDKFYHTSVRIIICISRSEGKSEAWKKKIVSELSEHDFFRQWIEKANVVVCFMGCVDKDAIDACESDKALIGKYQKVYNLRSLLLKHIFDAEIQVSLLDLPLSKGNKTKIVDLLQDQLAIIKRLEETKDLELGWVGPAVETFASNVELLMDLNLECFLVDLDVSAKYQDMKKRMKALCPRMPEKLRTNFIGMIVL